MTSSKHRRSLSPSKSVSLHDPPDPLPGPAPQMALLGADCGNICPRSLRLLLDGPDSLTPTREPHRANEPGSYPADVSDAARRVRSRRADRKPFRPDKGL